MGVGVGKGEEGRAKGRTFRFGGLRETEASLWVHIFKHGTWNKIQPSQRKHVYTL